MPDRSPGARFRRRVVVFAPALIVVATGVLSFASVRRDLASRARVMHTRDVLDVSANLLIALLDAEASQRGFVLARDSTFLTPLRGAMPRADSLIERLRALTRANPLQQARIDTLANRTHARLAVIDSSVSLAGRGDIPGATKLIASGPGQSLVADVRRLIASVEAEEERLLTVREQTERASSRLTSVLVVLGTILAGALAVVVNRNLERALVERRHALKSVTDANERLQQQAVELEVQAEAAQAAVADAELASENAQRAVIAAEESEDRAERLQAATEAFSMALSLDEVAHLILDQAMAALDAVSGVLASLESGDVLRLVAVRNVSAARVGGTIDLNEEMSLCVAVRTGSPVVVDSPEGLRARFPGLVSFHEPEAVQAVAAFPMESDRRILGGLLVRFDHPRPLTPFDRAFMIALSRIAAESFERARLFEAERAARTAAEAANRAKAAFLASMSHELRTPLQAALGFAQLVRSGIYGPVNEQQMEILGRVERSQMHLARLIDDILDFARLEAGRVRMETERVPLQEVIAELQPLVEPQAAKKQIELSLHPPADALIVTADRHRLQQVLVNLVGNAIKFTAEGGTIRVGALRNGDAASIHVQDTGIGIPPDRIEAIFEPFVQVDDRHTRAHSGAGLGLAISRDLARAMGGDLTVESTLGEGSTFTIRLPLVAEHASS